MTIHWTVEDVRETVSDFVSLSVNEAQKEYNLRKDTRDWKVHLAQADLRNHPDADQHVKPINYRPFDTRWTYYTGRSKGFHCMPRPENMPHLFTENLALSVCRIVKSPAWQHALITDKITENCYISNTTSESGHVFPLYLYPDPEELGLETERSLNFRPAFLTALSEALALPQIAPFNIPEGVSPEEILAYIYAVLYSPTYRERYYEFLRYDFPRIPLPQNIELFRKLAALGQNLIEWHLLKNVQVPPRHRFEGEGEGIISKIRYESGHVWINATHHFTDVPAEVWEYEIGAYQVCEKWLKDKKGSSLKHNEVRQYCAMLVAVSETLQTMKTIDGAFSIQLKR